MEIYNQLIERLQQSVDQPSLYKFFYFTMEDLQDYPDRLMEIADYIERHKGSYEDFRIHTWVDSETFKPMIMLQLYPNAEYHSMMKSPISTRIQQYYKQQNKKD